MQQCMSMLTLTRTGCGSLLKRIALTKSSAELSNWRAANRQEQHQQSCNSKGSKSHLLNRFSNDNSNSAGTRTVVTVATRSCNSKSKKANHHSHLNEYNTNAAATASSASIYHLLYRTASTAAQVAEEVNTKNDENSNKKADDAQIESHQRQMLNKIQVAHDHVNRLLSKLDEHVRRNGRITERECRELFNLLHKITPTSNQALIALRCCSGLQVDRPPVQRNAQLTELWNHLKAKNVVLDISHYNSLLSAYLQNGFNFEAQSILDELKKLDLQPNRVTYQRLIHRCCVLGDMQGAIRILEQMRLEQLPINELVFNSLILGYCNIQDYDTAQQTLALMKESGIEPSSDTYTTFLIGSLQSFGLDATAEMINSRIDQIFTQASTDEVELSDKNILDVIRQSRLDESSPIYDRLIERLERGLNYNSECVVAIIDLINNKRVDLALKMLGTLNKPNASELLPTKNEASFFVQQLVRAGIDRDKVCSILTKFKEEKINELSFNRAAETALEYGDRETGLFYLNKFIEQKDFPIRSHYFWPLLAKSKTDEELLDLLKIAQSAQDGSLARTLRGYVWPQLKGNLQEFAARLVESGFNKSVAYTTAMQHLVSQNQLEEAMALINEVTDVDFMRNNNILFQDLLTLVDENKDVLPAFNFLQGYASLAGEVIFSDFLEAFVYAGFGTSSQLLNKLLQLYDENRIRVTRRTSAFVLDGKFGLGQEQRNIIEKLSRSNVRSSYSAPTNNNNIDPVNLRNQLLQLCRNNQEEKLSFAERAERIETLVNQIEKLKFKLYNPMKASLIGFYASVSRDLDRSLQYYNQLSSDFRLGNDRLLSIASLLCEQNRIEEAKQLILNESAKSAKDTAIDKDLLEERIDRIMSNMLQTVLQKGNDKAIDHFDEMISVTQKLLNRKPSGRWLGLKVKYYLDAGNLDQALETYFDCITKFRSAPRLSDLMRLLIEKQDSVTLQKVTDAAIRVLSEARVLFDLSIAFLFTDRERQARKILQTPGLRIYRESIVNAAEYLLKLDRLDVLEKFTEITKNLVDVDRQTLYLYLIKGYIAKDDKAKAMNVWTSMQEEDVLPGFQIMSLLAKYLKEKGEKVPFQVPSRKEAKVIYNKESFEAKSDTKDNLNLEFMRALRASDMNTASKLRDQLLHKKELSLNEECTFISALIKNDNLSRATVMVCEMCQASRYPAPQILRTLTSKLAERGEWNLFERLEPLLPATIKESGFFNINKMESYIRSKDKSDDFLVNTIAGMKPFPLVSLLLLLNHRPSVEEKVIDLALKQSRELDYHLPINFVWMHFMINHQFDKADKLFAASLKLRGKLLYNNILEKVQEKKDVALCHKLVDVLKQTELSPNAVGKAYNQLLRSLLDLGKVEEAEEVVIGEIANEAVTRTSLEFINRITLNRLTKDIATKLNRAPKFELPPENDKQEQNDD